MERVVNRLITTAFAGVVGMAIGYFVGLRLMLDLIDRDGYVTDKQVRDAANYLHYLRGNTESA